MEKEHNPFAVLGLDKNASLDSVKNAYRRLAMRWHPDRNPDPSAAAHFQMVQAAYELLSAQLATEQTAHQKRDCHQNLSLTLAQAFLGGAQTVRVVRKMPCLHCEGSGQAGLARNVFCRRCLGSGKILNGQQLEKCADCGGKGLIVEQICPDCAGKGFAQKEVVLSVNVPKGVLTGDELRLVGQGECAENESDRAGDLYLHIVVQSDAFFRLENRDLHCTVPVSVFDFLIGHTLDLPFFGSVLRVEIEPLTQHWVLKNSGFPGGKNGQTGDLFLHFSPVYPAQLSEKAAKALKKMAKTESIPPEVLQWQTEIHQHDEHQKMK